MLERLLGLLFVPYLEITDGFRSNQFAYRKNRGLRDALAFNVASWIHMIYLKLKIALYCSDVSSAFDRVARQKLATKLRNSGIHEDIIDIICDWLAAR